MNEELANQQVQAFVDAVKNLKDMDDNLFSDEALDTILQSIDQSFSKEQINQSVSQIIANLEAQGTTRAEAKESVKSLKEFVNQIVYGDQRFMKPLILLMINITSIQLNYQLCQRMTHKFLLTLMIAMLLQICMPLKI